MGLPCAVQVTCVPVSFPNKILRSNNTFVYEQADLSSEQKHVVSLSYLDGGSCTNEGGSCSCILFRPTIVPIVILPNVPAKNKKIKCILTSSCSNS